MKELHALKTSALAIASAAALAARGAQFSASAPASVRVDGEERPGIVSIGQDGRVTVRSERPLSWVEVEWAAPIGAGAKVFGGDFERTYGDAG